MVVLSGMRPTGKLHLGHLYGALDMWVKLQKENDCIFFVADFHALTTEYKDPSKIKEYTEEMIIDWLCVGIDPKKSIVFVQSHVLEHAELHLLFSMITPLGWLYRNPTYKEQMTELKEKDLRTYGFLGYPVLQAADILIYKAEKVPVGLDQVPHLELTREIARRFNHLYKEIFPLPEPILTEFAKIPGTDGKKMSKSYGNAIYLSDSEDELKSKVMNMFTDPKRARKTDPGTPETCAVWQYHRLFSEEDEVLQIQRDCKSAKIGCVDCKKRVYMRMKEALSPFREKRIYFERHRSDLLDIISFGRERARTLAKSTISEVREALSFLRR